MLLLKDTDMIISCVRLKHLVDCLGPWVTAPASNSMKLKFSPETCAVSVPANADSSHAKWTFYPRFGHSETRSGPATGRW